MENSKNYHDEQNNLNTMRMREVVATLPSFCKQFFRGIQEYTSSRTRLAYAYDLRVFFEFLHTENPHLSKYEILFFLRTFSIFLHSSIDTSERITLSIVETSLIT